MAKSYLRSSISAAALLGAAIFLIVYSSLTLGADSALFPRIIGVIMVLLSGFLLVTNLRRWRLADKREPEEKQGPYSLPIFALAALVIVGYIICINLLGFFVSTAAFLPLSMWLLDFRKLKVILPFTALFILFLLFVFRLQLNVPLPSGLLL